MQYFYIHKMKTITYILSLIAFGLVIYNCTKINFQDPLARDSIVAIITVLAGLCVILLLTILRISKKIERLSKRK